MVLTGHCLTSVLTASSFVSIQNQIPGIPMFTSAYKNARNLALVFEIFHSPAVKGF